MNLGKLAKKVKGVVDRQGDKVASGVDKATDFVDKKTKGKYTEKLEKVDQLADKLDKTKGEASPPESGAPPAAPPPA
ncbi:MAG: antitoxin [Acidimicrobiales bacterium]